MATPPPDMLAALAVSREVFCAAFVFPDYDQVLEEEFPEQTAFLLYDGTLSQPWGRIDIPRNIRDICLYNDPVTGKEIFVALSREGDVYYLRGDRIDHEHIPGAGVHNDNATVNAFTQAIRSLDGVLVVCGGNSQLYRRDPEGWVWFGEDIPQPREGFNGIGFSKMAGTGLNDLYLNGDSSNIRPPLSEEDRRLEDLAYEAGNWQHAAKIREAHRKRYPHVGEDYYFHWNGVEWRKTLLDGKDDVKAFLIERPDLVWMSGFGGFLVRGNGRDGFEPVETGSKKKFLSITKFRDDYILASDNQLHRYDGEVLHPLKPRMRQKKIPTPLKVQAVDDVLFYFDYQYGIRRWDGENWEEIRIPPELLEREFTGLKRP